MKTFITGCFLLAVCLAALSCSKQKAESGADLAPEELKQDPAWTAEVQKRQAPLLKELESLDLHRALVTLYTLQPDSLRKDLDLKTIPQPAGVRSFRDWRVLGVAVISDQQEKVRLLAELVRGGRESDGTVTPCFRPRHGLSIENDGKAVDVVVCFECLRAEVFGLSSGSEFVTSDSPHTYYEEMVRTHVHPLAD